MSTPSLNFDWRMAIFVAVIGVSTLFVIPNHSLVSGQAEPRDFGTEMVRKVKEGRFDEAIQIGLRALQNQPSDEFVYQQIADVYLIRAGKELDLKEQWISQAVSYTEKSLALNSKERDAAGVHLLQDARSFETAGDVSTSRRCQYYDRAQKILHMRAPLLQGDQITIEGRVFPLAPLRKENDMRSEEVRLKRAKANCK